MTDKSCVMVVGEVSPGGGIDGTTAEVMTLAARLSREMGCGLTAVVAGESAGGAAGELATMGPETVFVAESPALARYIPDAFLAVVRAAVDRLEPGTILLANSPLGQDLAPRIALALEGGLVTDCLGIEVEDGARAVCTRPIYGGNALASMVSSRSPLVATVRQHAFEAAACAGGSCEIVSLTPDLPRADNYVTGERVRECSDDIALEDAGVVVSGGRGVGGRDGFDELEGLARLLGGAVGASRPPVDSGWVSTTAQVGITGKIVAPDAYIAVGLSGSSQHLTGMSDSRKIIAVNSDSEAYIFKVSDY
ncbi:MAG: electron transfer flavoprotein subunit alpha/FixB family protein [Candidatus Geothermincolia bacterium]